MRAILLALALLTVTPDVLAGGAVWVDKRVKVYDHTGPELQPLVRQTVTEFNRMLPPRAPKLKYRSRPSGTCRTPKRGLAVCERPGWGSGVGLSAYRVRQHAISRSRVMVGAGEFAKGTLCHEFMHALVNAPDDKATGDWSHETTSCVQGIRDDPGPWDRRFARKAYRQHGRH